jgi:glycosyltransferase involved in cell wall biosynthesis
MKGNSMNTENINGTEAVTTTAETIIEENIPEAKFENYAYKISVIMPIYNADDYISKAIETILSQTFEDFELICVDDGSTDKSVEIVKSFAKSDKRIKLVEMSHIGVSTARNKGLLKSQGEYIIFLDADDFYEDTLLEKLYNTATELNLDIVATDFDLYDNKKARYIKSPEEEHGNIYAHGAVASKNEFPDYILQSTTGYVWNKLFRSAFLKEKEILFAPELYVFEDVYFVCCALSLADRVSRVSETLVHHRIYQLQHRAKIFRKHYDQVPVVYLRVKEFLMRHGMYIPLSKSFLNFSASRCYKIFNLVPSDKKDDFWDLLHRGYADSLGWYRHEAHDFEHIEIYDFVANIGLYSYDEYAKLKLKGKLEKLETMTLDVLKKKIKQLHAKAKIKERFNAIIDKIKGVFTHMKNKDSSSKNTDSLENDK